MDETFNLQLSGIHHLTAVTADAPGNLRFYTQVLGLRLVKKTVNQDDTTAYHLFYADGLASPGTDLTFFDWPVGREQRGAHSITRTGLRVSGRAAMDYWKARLDAHGVKAGDVHEMDGRLSLDFEDAEGQRFRLVDDGGAGPSHPWEKSPVPAQFQIRGLGPITLTVPELRNTGLVLEHVMNMREVRTYQDGKAPVHVFEMGAGGAAAELHIAVQQGLPVAVQGAGAVHHVAFRVRDTDELRAWTEHLRSVRLPSSGEVERYYFRSLYFREPNGILFELATDGPGFAVDEPLETLGESLSLPPFLEPKRVSIEAKLKPLT